MFVPLTRRWRCEASWNLHKKLDWHHRQPRYVMDGTRTEKIRHVTSFYHSGYIRERISWSSNIVQPGGGMSPQNPIRWSLEKCSFHDKSLLQRVRLIDFPRAGKTFIRNTRYRHKTKPSSYLAVNRSDIPEPDLQCCDGRKIWIWIWICL